MGASGWISSVALSPVQSVTDRSQYWKLAALTSFCWTASLFFGPEATRNVSGDGSSNYPEPSTLGYILAGLLVGMGTKLGNGCTSGHGVCGLGRLSKRSLCAVLTFMGTAAVSSWLVGPMFLAGSENAIDESSNYRVPLALGLATIAAPLLWKKETPSTIEKDTTVKKSLVGAVAGSIFAIGLAISQMAVPDKVRGFLQVGGILDGTWDPTLATVMGSAIPISMICYYFVPVTGRTNHSQQLQAPVCASKFSIPTDNTTIDSNLLIGAALFGVGWGLGNLCPGPALFSLAIGHNRAVNLCWMPGFWVGSYAAQAYKASKTKTTTTTKRE